MRNTALFLLAAVLTLGSHTASAGQLTGPEISKLFSGKILYTTSSRGTVVQSNYEQGGVLSGSTGSNTQMGTWSIEGNMLCRGWSGSWSSIAPRGCFSLEINGSRLIWRNPDGSVHGITDLPK